MSLAGSLEDVRVIDLVQFIHLGKRTGTLVLDTPARGARLGFEEGQLRNASLGETPPLGELLVLAGLVSPPDLAEAMAAQRETPRPIGNLLIDLGAVGEAEVRELLASQLVQTVQEIVTWRRGSFEFLADDRWPVDGLATPAGDAPARIEIDTQAVLAEAANRIEPARRSGLPPMLPFGESSVMTWCPEVTVPGPPPALNPERPGAPRIQLLTRDATLVERLGERLHSEGARVTGVNARDAGFSLPDEPAPIVIIDLRQRNFNLESIRSLRRSRPRASVVAYCTPLTAQAPIYEAGAAAVVHGDDAALASCVQRVSRVRVELSTEARIQRSLQDGFDQLGRIVADLRSGLLSATVSLNLMHVVAESIERAVLLIIDEERLIPVGSFGSGVSADKLTRLGREARLSLREPSVFAECADSDRPRFALYGEDCLPAAFRAAVSRPHSGTFGVLPVSGSTKVIALIYIDNGSNERAMADVQLLELAVSHLGLALENELLQRSRDAYRRTGHSAATP